MEGPTADIADRRLPMSDATTILLIDGSLEDREYYTQRLRTSSPDRAVLQAITGRAGLILYKRQPIDCVVLELDLDDMSGFEVLVNLVPRVYQPDIAVIVLTRLSNPYFLEAAIKNGAHAALHKSMTSGDILDKTVLKALSAIPKDRKRLGP